MKPVDIIGGGLAGLALGIALRRQDVPVSLSEAGSYPRHRVCGESICGVQPDLFIRLGMAATIADARRGQSVQWFFKDRPIASFNLPTPAWQISRHRLDQRLADLFTATGGILHIGDRRSDNDHPAGTVLAAGRCTQRAATAVGLKVHIHNLALSADLEVHLGDQAYVGLCQIEDQRINVCGLFRRRSPAPSGLRPIARLLHSIQAAGMPALAERLSGADIDSGSFCGVSRLFFGWQPSLGPSPPRIGDHLALIPPFTGNGMAMAFQSADSAVQPLQSWSQGQTSWEETCHLLYRIQRRQFRRRLHSAAALHPALLSSSLQPALSFAAQTGMLSLRALCQLIHS